MRIQMLTALAVVTVAVAPTVTIAQPVITVKSVEDQKVVQTIKGQIDLFELPTKEEMAQKQIEENLKKIEEARLAEEARKAEVARIAAEAKKAAEARAARLKAQRAVPVAIKASAGTAEAIEYGRVRNAAVFGEQHWSALYSLWSKESGWRSTALNKSSGACGIPQFISGCILGDHVSQIDRGLVYIAKRYGNPTNAWNFFLKNRWY